MNVYLQISIHVKDEAASDLLVALLSRAGFEGFEEEEELLYAFIPQDFYQEAQLKDALETATAALHLAETPVFSVKPIEPKNWNEKWEQDFQPVVFGDFCAVRAAFHDPVPNVRHELVITPKMSFGTGHHASTAMMIEAMQALDFYAEKVLDFGTGTGLLAILAEKMGAVEVRAIDADAWSIENAAENIKANQAGRISLEQKDSLSGEPLFDIILANISLQVILGNLRAFRQHLDENGVVIASGVLASDEEKIRREAMDVGFLMNILFIRDNWMSFSLKKRGFADEFHEV